MNRILQNLFTDRWEYQIPTLGLRPDAFCHSGDQLLARLPWQARHLNLRENTPKNTIQPGTPLVVTAAAISDRRPSKGCGMFPPSCGTK